MRTFPRAAAFLASALLSAAALAQQATVGLIELDGDIPARHKTMGLGGLPAENSLGDVLNAIDQASRTPGLKALVIRLKDLELDRAGVDELGAAIDRVRAAGRKVHLYAEEYDTPKLPLGAHCDEVILQQGGQVSVAGVYMEEMFLADAFKWVGVTPDFVQVGDFKGASEMYANAKPSPQWDQNINSLLDALYAHTRDTLKKGRRLSEQQLDEAYERGWMAGGATARAVKLVDSELDLPDLTAHLEKVYGKFEWDDAILPDPQEAAEKKLSGSPFALLGAIFHPVEYKPTKPTIAVLHIDGAIVDGESGGGGLFSEGGVGARSIKRAVEELLENKHIKGVVLRIDSPGGSAVASEMIWQSVKRLRKSKPVFVSVGSMAASGGYYLAVSGERIYVNPSSIVGSIGVVGGRMALGGAYEKLHINVVPRARGPHAGIMQGTATPWSEKERALIKAKMTETYDLFTSRVTEGRKGIDLSKTAEGRLFMGQQAIDLKMADKVGGLENARDDLAAKLHLKPGEYDVMDYPAPDSFIESIAAMAKGLGVRAPGRPSAAAPAAGPVAAEVRAIVRSLVGRANEEQLFRAMAALWQLRTQRVVLTSPRILIFK